MLEGRGQDWTHLMFIITIVSLALAVLIFLTVVAEPREVGIDMRDDHHIAASGCTNDANTDDY